jgi:hypothetical protein
VEESNLRVAFFVRFIDEDFIDSAEEFRTKYSDKLYGLVPVFDAAEFKIEYKEEPGVA